MLVYLTAAAVAAFYIANVPVRVALSLEIGSNSRLTVGVGLFRRDWMLRSVFYLSPDAIQGRIRKYKGARSKLSLGSGLRYLLKRTNPERMWVKMRLGTNDAAHTAVWCGLAEAAARGVAPFWRRGTVIHIVPEYREARLTLSLGGILSYKLGHIMAAVVFILTKTIKGRIRHGASSD